MHGNVANVTNKKKTFLHIDSTKVIEGSAPELPENVIE